MLTFQGINYAADVWVNGQLVASNTTVAGAYQYFDFDVSSVVNLGTPSAVALLIYPPNDLVNCVMIVYCTQPLCVFPPSVPVCSPAYARSLEN